ncbi:alpha/beta fold hydrolase [Pelagibacterium luteolum]|uniref:3-oxoadipate enol-lactonase n=1 Tax=Pelagibacterium luteolum TaxID=440168 RepID=A0A1G8AB62_9HYPH|nr:alpha/beta fold hydrolase [Pelagibacterium luteolum]SDH18214.1 3-oxoadipate enol-lactonase [Pelagibacterium luteolum]
MGASLFSRIEHAGADAPWIMFGNSLMTDLSIWDAQARALSGHYNIMRYDQRGHGGSPLGAPGFSFDDLGQDLLDLLDREEITTCLYVGLSMGVPTGLAAYAHQPGRFSGLIFVDGQAASTPSSQGFWSERIATAQSEGMGAIAAQTIARWLQPENRTGPKAETLADMISATPLEGFIACASLLMDYDQTAAFNKVAVPLALVAGAQDGAMPDTMKALAARHGHARFVAIESAGHVPNFERPEAFNTVLTGILADFAQGGHS